MKVNEKRVTRLTDKYCDLRPTTIKELSTEERRRRISYFELKKFATMPPEEFKLWALSIEYVRAAIDSGTNLEKAIEAELVRMDEMKKEIRTID